MTSESDEVATVGSADDAKQLGEASARQASSDVSTRSKREPEVWRPSAAPVLSYIADMDLVELSLVGVLSQAATDVLGSIPAQHCIVYIYDKDANLLRPQVVVDCHDKDPEETTGKLTEPCDQVLLPASGKTVEVSNNSSSVDITSGDVSSLVSFPPVMGMVSSCFLQRRCLRMEEPNSVRPNAYNLELLNAMMCF